MCATWAAGSRCSACCRRFRTRWSGRSYFSITSGRSILRRARASTCARIRISDWRPSPICSKASQMHRDSAGSVQRIEPGDVNWMTAGLGIVHSERSTPEERAAGHRLHGLQTWVALPKAHEQREPSFSHHAKAELPVIERAGREHAPDRGHGVRPARTDADVLADFLCRRRHGRRRVAGRCRRNTRSARSTRWRASCASTDEALPPRHMAVLEPATTVRIDAVSASRCMLLGGAKDGRRPVDLVELRRQLARTDRRGVRALARAGFSARARRDGVHPAPGAINRSTSLHAPARDRGAASPRPAAARSSSTLSIASQVNSGSSRPKWP